MSLPRAKQDLEQGTEHVVYLELTALNGQLEPPLQLLEYAKNLQTQPACTQLFLLKSREQVGLFLLESFWSSASVGAEFGPLEGWKVRLWHFERLALGG
jgi:hypothetical protein